MASLFASSRLPLASAQEASLPPSGLPPFLYDLEGSEPSRFSGGTLRTATVENIPALKYWRQDSTSTPPSSPASRSSATCSSPRRRNSEAARENPHPRPFSRGGRGEHSSSVVHSPTSGESGHIWPSEGESFDNHRMFDYNRIRCISNKPH